MKRSADASILAFVCLVLISSIGCGSSNPNPSTPALTPKPETFAITAASGSGQSTASGKPFSAPLVASVTAGGIRTSGIKVTFTAPTTGPSGTFANGSTTDVEISNAAGTATSSVFTANSAVGNFSITATVSGAPKPVPFALTILAPVANTSYVFYLNGEDTSGNSFYALAGSVTIDANGKVLGGEQDYVDTPFGGASSPEPGGDTISGTGSSLTIDPNTGQGTLTLATSNLLLGLQGDGVEVLGLQFVNPKHALVTQFDGFATSSGSMDLQTSPSTPSGNYAFTLSGVDSNFSAVAFGGVFTVSGNSITNGVFDVNDASVAAVTKGTTMNGTITPPDSFGRGTITGLTNPLLGPPSVPISLNYYIIGPEVLRIIDVDSNPNSPTGTDSGIGSAFGQGTAAFSNASLGSSVLAVAGNILNPYDALGQFTTNGTASPATFVGVGDESEPNDAVLSSSTPQPVSISGTYSIASNGYGNLGFTINSNTFQGLGNIGALGVYLTDPTLNLNDPNNLTGGGGALVVDLDDGSETGSGIGLPGGTGVIVPQTSTSPASFAGNYAAGWQTFNFNFCGCEFDMIAQGTMVANGGLSLTGSVSDPGLIFGSVTTSQGDTFTGTPLPDPNESTTGRYSMLLENTPANPLSATINGSPFTFEMVIYQANGGQLFWLGYDLADFITNGLPTYVSLGPIEQATLTGLPAARKPAANAKANKKR